MKTTQNNLQFYQQITKEEKEKSKENKKQNTLKKKQNKN